MLLPLWAPYLESDLVHAFAGPLVIAIAFIALQRGFQIHQRKVPFVPALIGALCLLAAPVFHSHDHHQPLDALLSTIGGIFFILAHLWNVHLMHRAEHHWSDVAEPIEERGLQADYS